MYKLIKLGYIIIVKDVEQKKIEPIVYESKLWKIWRATITANTCYDCASMNGKIFSVDDELIDAVPVHPNCKCVIEALLGVMAGTVTDDGESGADVYLAEYGRLPEYYITKEEAESAGWKRNRGNLADVAPGKTIGGNIYKNRDHRLPEREGRRWYEADFDYSGGVRNDNRLLYSNDGLLFVTYDHYDTFWK